MKTAGEVLRIIGIPFMQYYAKKWLSSTAGIFSLMLKNQNQIKTHIWYMHNWSAKQQRPILKTLGEVIRTIGIPFWQPLASPPYSPFPWQDFFLWLIKFINDAFFISLKIYFQLQKMNSNIMSYKYSDFCFVCFVNYQEGAFEMNMD